MILKEASLNSARAISPVFVILSAAKDLTNNYISFND